MFWFVLRDCGSCGFGCGEYGMGAARRGWCPCVLACGEIKAATAVRLLDVVVIARLVGTLAAHN